MKLRFVEWILLAYLVAVLLATCLIFKKSNLSYTKFPHDDDVVVQRGYQRQQQQKKLNYFFNSFFANSSGDLQRAHLPLRRQSHQLLETNLSFESDIDRKYWNQWAQINLQRKNLSISQNLKPRISNSIDHVVDIWSNNGLGDYLWEHLIQGELRLRSDYVYKHGEKIINKIKYRYKGGESMTVGFLPEDTENIVLVLNGRSNSTAVTTRLWLDMLSEFEALQNVGLVLIGDELCANDWLIPYLYRNNVTSPKFVFMVYDSPVVDDKTVYQFPLGVATYRGFPLPSFPDLVVSGERKYRCNFIGTIYRNSSREVLIKNLNIVGASHNHGCYLGVRYIWLPEETEQGLSSYLSVLKSSDLTLCPVGKNSESYRIYEAMSVGSVPVIEDVVVNVNCSTTPYRLLKRYNAPVIYIKHWSQLPNILANEEQLSLTSKERRREEVLAWYKRFRMELSRLFTSTVRQRFFGVS